MIYIYIKYIKCRLCQKMRTNRKESNGDFILGKKELKLRTQYIGIAEDQI